MNPVFPEGLKFVDATYDSRYGKIESHWKKSATRLDWEIVVPANTTADVYLPSTDESKILESGKTIRSLNASKKVLNHDKKLVITVGSGHYHFSVLK